MAPGGYSTEITGHYECNLAFRFFRLDTEMPVRLRQERRAERSLPLKSVLIFDSRGL